MIKPAALKEGDKIATVSLSWGGPGAFPHRYEAGKKQLRDAFALDIVEIAQLLAVAIKRLKNREKMTIAQVELSGLHGPEERSWN